MAGGMAELDRYGGAELSTTRYWVLSANGNPMMQNEVAGCVVFPSRYGYQD
jgi:hypothetical protein